MCVCFCMCVSLCLCAHMCVCVCVGGHACQETNLVTQRLEVLWKHKNSGSADLLNKSEFFTDDGATEPRCDIRRKSYEKGTSAKR